MTKREVKWHFTDLRVSVGENNYTIHEAAQSLICHQCKKEIAPGAHFLRKRAHDKICPYCSVCFPFDEAKAAGGKPY